MLSWMTVGSPHHVVCLVRMLFYGCMICWCDQTEFVLWKLPLINKVLLDLTLSLISLVIHVWLIRTCKFCQCHTLLCIYELFILRVVTMNCVMWTCEFGVFMKPLAISSERAGHLMETVHVAAKIFWIVLSDSTVDFYCGSGSPHLLLHCPTLICRLDSGTRFELGWRSWVMSAINNAFIADCSVQIEPPWFNFILCTTLE